VASVPALIDQRHQLAALMDNLQVVLLNRPAAFAVLACNAQQFADAIRAVLLQANQS
jgi:hypothetical protein